MHLKIHRRQAVIFPLLFLLLGVLLSASEAETVTSNYQQGSSTTDTQGRQGRQIGFGYPYSYNGYQGNYYRGWYPYNSGYNYYNSYYRYPYYSYNQQYYSGYPRYNYYNNYGGYRYPYNNFGGSVFPQPVGYA